MVWTAVLAVVVVASLAAVVLPFFRAREPWDTPNKESELDRLLAEKQRVLRTLKDLDQERLAGLMSESDHAAGRETYLERAVELNRDIASLTGVDPTRMADSVVS
jgi:hypothetical protein